MLTATKNKATYSVRMDQDLRGGLEYEARAEMRPASNIVVELVESYLVYKKEKRERILFAQEEMERGETIPGELVMSAMKKWSKSKSNKPFVFEDYV